jgi:DNA-binding transcriptional LysR family regulator
MVAADMGVTLVPKMMIEREIASGCVALPFAPPIPVRELNLLRNPLRLESKAAATFRREAADAFYPKGYRSLAT